ncbi:hypothetical protein [Sporocytophaga myxococcoides]|uniref:hypothetical protein n=1 Tax=Sporocytophaga myxococcoides TaxID=153721 RepID=UPI000424F45C|nr:hypothetical protein [Sporocytophaga myxococcoides]
MEMKSFISITMAMLLFLGGLFCNDMEEVFKVPSLISHYLEHKKTASGDFSFVDFLKMHYGSSHAHDANNPDLPFYHHNYPPLTFTITFPFELNFRTFKKETFYFSFYKRDYFLEVSLSTFKPPKV